MRALPLLAAVLCFCAASAVAAGPFADVSPVEATHVLSVIAAAGPGFSSVPQSSIDVLKKLDASVPEQRALLAPLNEALGQIYSEGQDKGAVFTRALRILDARQKTLLADAAREDAAPARLGESVERLEQMKRFVAFYQPAEAAAFDASVAKARELYEGKKAAELAAAGTGMAGALGSPAAGTTAAAGPAVEDGETAVARSLVDELAASDDLEEGQEIVERLERVAKLTKSEPAQRAIVEGLVADLRSSSDVDYGRYVIDALERIATQTSFSNVQQIAIQGVMDDVLDSSDLDYAQFGLDAVERIAVQSGDARVRGLAIGLLLREKRQANDEDYETSVQNAVDRIGASHAGGLAAIPIPAIDGQSAPILESPAPRAAASATAASWKLSASANLIIKVVVGLLGYLLLLRLSPPGLVKQLTGEVTTAAALNFFFGPLKDYTTDAVVFALFIAGIVAATVLAPIGFVVQAVGAVGTAYALALFFL